VVTGHGVLEPDSSPRHIEETRRYIHDFNRTVATSSTASDLYEKMMKCIRTALIRVRSGVPQTVLNHR
jgi:hypothetical protein